MRPSRRHPLFAAHDRSSAVDVPRGMAAPPDRLGSAGRRLKEAVMDEIESKDRLLIAVLPDVPFDGWSVAALRAGARAAGMSEAEAMALFPRAGADLVAWFSHWADRGMLARLDEGELANLKV